MLLKDFGFLLGTAVTPKKNGGGGVGNNTLPVVCFLIDFHFIIYRC